MSDRFARIEALFQEARRLPADQRSALLAGSPADLREEVESLLREHDRDTQPFLETPALGKDFKVAPVPAETMVVPERIGPYRILERIGEGGMGAVYLAEQDQPRRVVALKIIRPGWATPAMRRRFQHEAEVLGRLRHPGIAQIYDAGLDEQEHGDFPHIAMEYVDGRPLHEYIAKEHPDLAERLDLFAQVCDAVEHAHAKGVIHRDLKPGNILVEDVDGKPRPRVLDFGIARITDADVALTTMRTSLGQLVGTLQYMSPEQAAGDSTQLDHRSDVYSLGVILFEMLTGRLPYDLGKGMVHQAVSVIQHEEPTALAAIDTSLRGDLDTIVGKALEKDRQRRYPSAGALAADIRRFLAHEPILARAPSTLYQLGKFARRNRILVAGVSAVIVALSVGLASTLWQWRETEAQRALAEGRFEDLDELARFFIAEFDSTLMHVPGTLEARRLIVSRGLDYLDRLAQESELDPERQQTIISGYSRIGDIQGAPQQPNIGDVGGALASYRKALALNQGLLNDERGWHTPHLSQASLLARMGDVFSYQQAYEKALEHYQQALVYWNEYHDRAATSPRPPNPYRDRIAERLLTLGRQAQADDEFRIAHEEAVHWAALHPGEWKIERHVLVALMKVAMQEERGQRLEESLTHYAEYLELGHRLLADEPHNAILLRDLATGYNRRRDVQVALGRTAEALRDNTQAEHYYSQLVEADPTSAQALMDWALAVNAAGEMALAAGDLPEARSRFEQFCDISAQLVARDPDHSGYLRRRGVALFKMGEYHKAREEWALARDWFHQSYKHFRNMESRGLIWQSDLDAGVIEEIAGEITACIGADLQQAEAELKQAPLAPEGP